MIMRKGELIQLGVAGKRGGIDLQASSFQFPAGQQEAGTIGVF